MAGRPRTMARKVAALEQRLFEVGDDLWLLKPKMYKDRGHTSTDPLNQAWVGAVAALADAYAAVRELSRLTAAKAEAPPPPEPCSFVAVSASPNAQCETSLVVTGITSQGSSHAT